MAPLENGRFDRSVRIWVNSALKKMGAEELVDRLSWIWNPRLSSTIGRARLLHFRTAADKQGLWVPLNLELSPSVFDLATVTQRKWAVYHEVAHAVDAQRGSYNPKRPHGKSWKALMVKAGVEPHRCHDVFRGREL